jgi:hypothetical protein
MGRICSTNELKDLTWDSFGEASRKKTSKKAKS